MSNRGAVLPGIGIGNPISFAEMNAAQANRQHLELQKKQYAQDQQNRQDIRKQANATYLSNVLDKKDFLSGSPYDPMIIQGLDNAMKQGMELAGKGADTPTIMMAIGPLVGKLNEYQSKAKLIESNIKTSADKLKQFSGYNSDGIIDESKRAAYFNADGTMKDISQVDPQLDYTSMALRDSPEKTTTSAWLDDLVNKTPMSEESKEVQTMHKGLKKNMKYDIKRNYWEGVAEDDNGNARVDKNGQPIGIDVKSHVLKGKDGKPMIDPETNEPFRVMDDQEFKGIMSRNPAAASNIDGQVRRHFAEAGATSIPSVGSPEWEDMAKHILYQELKARSRSSFKQRDIETKSAPLTKIELGIPAYAPKKGSTDNPLTINDIYKDIAGDKRVQNGEAVMLEKFGDPAEVIVEKAKKRGYDDRTQEDFYIHKDSDGVIKVYDRPTGKAIFPLNEKDVNLSKNKTVKTSQEVLKKAGGGTYKIKGKTYTHKELMDMGYTPEQVSQYKQ